MSRTKDDSPFLLTVKLLTLAQVCECLGITSKTLLQHIRAGKLPYINVGFGDERKNRRFHPDDLAAFIDKQRTYEVLPQGTSRVSWAKKAPQPMIDFTKPMGFTERYGLERERKFDIGKIKEERKAAKAGATVKKGPSSK